MVRRAWESRIAKIEDCKVNIGGWMTRQDNLTDTNPPPWALLSKASIWSSDSYAELRRFLLTPRVQIEVVRRSDNQVITMHVSAPEGASAGPERGSISLFDGKKPDLPTAVATTAIGYCVCPAKSPGEA